MLSSSSGSASLLTLLPVLLLTAASSTFQTVHATYTCDTSLGTYYPYCVNVPDDASGDMPTVLFLSGSGARGSASDVESLVSWIFSLIDFFFLWPSVCLLYRAVLFIGIEADKCIHCIVYILNFLRFTESVRRNRKDRGKLQ